MANKHDFKKVERDLINLLHDGTAFDCEEFILENKGTIQFALRLAERLQSGTKCFDYKQWDEIHTAFIRKFPNCNINHNALSSFFLKAITTQLVKEIEYE